MANPTLSVVLAPTPNSAVLPLALVDTDYLIDRSPYRSVEVLVVADEDVQAHFAIDRFAEFVPKLTIVPPEHVLDRARGTHRFVVDARCGLSSDAFDAAVALLRKDHIPVGAVVLEPVSTLHRMLERITRGLITALRFRTDLSLPLPFGIVYTTEDIDPPTGRWEPVSFLLNTQHSGQPVRFVSVPGDGVMPRLRDYLRTWVSLITLRIAARRASAELNR